LDLDLTPFTQDSRYDRAMLEAWSLEKMIQEKVPGIHAKPHEEETLIRWKN
jgi:hypothetical protein